MAEKTATKETENAEKKSNQNQQSHYHGAIGHLLESVGDKDESVRVSIEHALRRMCEKRPNDTLDEICEYKQKTPKLGEMQTAVLLRVIEAFVFMHCDRIDDSTLDKIIDLCITEMIKSPDHLPSIQNPSLEILVAIGRLYCGKVMDGLTAQLAPTHVAHFMIMNCLGTLATANINGIIPFIRPTLESTLPNLQLIKLDHIKQSYAFAIGRFAEAITEHLTNAKDNADGGEKPLGENYRQEFAKAYAILFQQWLPNREIKFCSEVLLALSHIYPLLPAEKVIEQVTKVIPQLQSFYRRSMDRNAITQMMTSVLKASIAAKSNSLDPLSDPLIISLFDLVCVNPDYEKPQTVKGHNEVLRCFDLLLDIYATKILEMLLIQLRSNNERERIKALLVVTHITNTGNEIVGKKINDLNGILKHMIQSENTIKVKLVMLKTIVALAQKALIQDNEFVRFILRHCCQQTKIKLEHGTVDEHQDFTLACNKSLFILATTVGTMDDLLKRELLQYYLLIEYTDVCCTITKCLGKLFGKNCTLPPESEAAGKLTLPNPETIFLRSLILLGNKTEPKRSEHILLFLKYYSKILNKLFFPMWAEEIPKLIMAIPEEDFEERVFKFLVETIKEFDNPTFPESLANRLADQLHMYPVTNPPSDVIIPTLIKERGMVLKLLGVCLNHISDNQTIEAKIEAVIHAARQEKLEKVSPHVEFESPLSDASEALGIIAKAHLELVLNKLDALIESDGTRKHSSNFFSNLNFIKDTQKEGEIYKINLLAIETYESITRNVVEPKVLTEINEKVINYLSRQLNEAKDVTTKTKVLKALWTISRHILKYKELFGDFKSKSDLLTQLSKIDATVDNLPLYPTIIMVATTLLQINPSPEFQIHVFFDDWCRKFFTAAQQLKTKFESAEEDDRNSFIAKFLNLSLPELNNLVKVIFVQNPSPSTLDDVNSVLEYWIRDKNSEVRICAGHVMNNALDCYIKTMKIGCEAPSKFNQTGAMLGKMVPRCIDTNARVRETSIDILKQILEISSIYETLTIVDSEVDWVKDLELIKRDIVTDDSKEIYRIAGEIARIISLRLSNFQHLQFSKTLLNGLDDPEESSSIGAAVILKNFIQLKGSEMFHAVPELVKECLNAISTCSSTKAKLGILKSLVALTKHHPKLVCSEMLSKGLPFPSNVIEFWQYVSTDKVLAGTIIDHFLKTLSSSCLYEQQEGGNDRQHIATAQTFAIFCALREMLPGRELAPELKQRFPEMFCMLLTSLATYTNLAPPTSLFKPVTNPKSPTTNTSTKSKFGFVPNKDAIKMNPCQVVLETFQAFLSNLDMEQISAVLTVFPNLSTSTELNSFMELLTPMAVGVVNQLGITSSAMAQLVTTMSKYISSPYDSQRIASVGLYSQIVPLKPSGEISGVILLHLNSALSDPNPLVRGFCVRGMAYVGNLFEHDVEKYSEMSLSALLKGIDDANPNCFINIPLESMKGLSRIVTALPGDKLETFQVSLAIRIRPFFENSSMEIREAAILLFGDLCKIIESDKEAEPTPTSEALKEQIFSNFFLLLLHLSENDIHIGRASKITLRKICTQMNAPKVNAMVQSHLLEHGQLQYDHFITNFVKVVAKELNDKIPEFIDSCLPYLKSTWPEIRGNAAVIIGLLHNLYSTEHQHTTENVSLKLSALLRDDQPSVRVKAANALGLMFGDALS